MPSGTASTVSRAGNPPSDTRAIEQETHLWLPTELSPCGSPGDRVPRTPFPRIQSPCRTRAPTRCPRARYPPHRGLFPCHPCHPCHHQNRNPSRFRSRPRSRSRSSSGLPGAVDGLCVADLVSRCRPGRLAGPLSDPVDRAGTTNRVWVCLPRRAGSSAWAPARPGIAGGSGAGARRRHRVVGVSR